MAFAKKPLKYFIIIVGLFNIFTLPAFSQDLQSDRIEFFPQVSISTFTADIKIGGQLVGGELVYYYTPKRATSWRNSLNIKGIDFIFNYKDMNDVRQLTDPNSSPFGNSYALLSGITIPVAKVKGTALNFSPAFGLGYLTETYFTSKNPSIGSHLNFASRVSLKLTQAISTSTKITAGIDALHFSNGGFRISNKGMNSINLGLGIVSALKFTEKTVDTISPPAVFHRHTLDFGIAWGQRGIFHEKESLQRGTLYLGYNYRLKDFLGFGTGLDAVYHHTVYNPLDHARTYEGNGTSFDHWKLGIAIGPDFWMGRLAMMAKYGYYLHFNSLYPIQTYWTAGLKYQLVNWAALQAKMYVHQTQAEFTGFGVIFTPFGK